MRARKIFENIAFKRGIGSKRSLGIGKTAVIKKWWQKNVTNRAEVNFGSTLDIIWHKIQEIAREENINFQHIKPSGHGGGWNPDKAHVQSSSTSFHLPDHITHYFDFNIDEEGDVWVITPSYLSGEKSKHNLGSFIEDPIELVHNLKDYINHLEEEIIPHFDIIKGKLKLSEEANIEFRRGISSKEALGLGEISEIRRKLKKLKYTNEVDPIIEQIRDMFADLLKQTKYSDDISFEGAYRAGGTDYAGLAMISILFNDVDYSLYLENSFPGNWQLYKPFTNPEYMGNIHSNTPRETLNSIIKYFKTEGMNESLEFQRGIGSKRALKVGSVGVRQQWWDEMRETGGVEAGHEIGNKLIRFFNEIGFQDLDLSGVGTAAVGIDTDKGEFEFDWDPAGDVCIKGHELGNLIQNPEEIAIRFKEDVYDKVDFATDTYRLLHPQVRLETRHQEGREKQSKRKWHDRFNPWKK